MIHALDHVVLAVRDLEAAVAVYETLLGRPCDRRSTGSGVDCAWLPAANMTLAIAAPTEPNAPDNPVAARLASAGDGLAGLAFAVADLDEARALAARRGLASTPAGTQHVDGPSGDWAPPAMAMLAAGATWGVPILLAHAPLAPAVPAAAIGPAAISGLDHIVVRTPDPERAAALYGARLGLDLRLDRSNAGWGSRLLFFRCGDLVVEIAHALGGGANDGPDTLWGLAWRTPDVAALQARLASAGVAVSEIRTGRRSGTRVFTIGDARLHVPTLVIGPG
jgi:catechol 2,3-dioxygenase-like lactoylglutathione lyase family enzyme